MIFSARMTSAAPRRSLRPQSRRFLRVTSRRRQRRRATPWNAWRSCKVPWERFKNHGENHGNIWKNNGKTMETYGKPWNMWNIYVFCCFLMMNDVGKIWKPMENMGKDMGTTSNVGTTREKIWETDGNLENDGNT